MVFVALPDTLHFPVVMDVLSRDHQIFCLKPLMMKYEKSSEIVEIGCVKGHV